MFTETQVINSTSVFPPTFWISDLRFLRFYPSEDHFVVFALGLWITWGCPVLSPVELPKNTTYNKHSALWLFCPQRSTDIDYSSFLLRSHNGSRVNFSPVVSQQELKSKEVNLSVLCYLSISIAVTLPGSHDRILMGPFSLVPSVPAFAKLSFPPTQHAPFTLPHPSLQDKEFIPLVERSCLAHCQLPLPPRDWRVQMLGGVIENKPNSNRGLVLFCARGLLT